MPEPKSTQQLVLLGSFSLGKGSNMLQIRELCKEYRTGGLVQRALDGVSLNLRDHEFVAILGPSGSGKTTLLNMIGGLDRYDSGDLLINGISTRDYTERDWDAYRNHAVGFVFQSYNLIPHQSVLSNVELALTLSGVEKEERRRRAAEVLQRVGLGDQLHKRPAQMSGGQMQRVAIARALVNDPDIILADEPTGALDSETSLQVMELLKEVSRERLVVMVTHNPELANRYATRIVRIRDGRITEDSDVFTPEAGAVPYALSKEKQGSGEAAAKVRGGGFKQAYAGKSGESVHGRKQRLQRPSMHFGTALALSFQNLLSKKARSLLVAVAGSIGIIGIALILSLSHGADNYISSMEEQSVAKYPITVYRTSIDFSAYFPQRKTKKKTGKAEVTEDQLIARYAGGIGTNDLKSLKGWLDGSGHAAMMRRAVSIEYNYDITPQLFRVGRNGSVRQVNPEQCLADLGMNNDQVTTFGLNAFYELPQSASIYRRSYRVKAGRWPRRYNEVVVSLDASGTVTDSVLYALGMKDSRGLDRLVHSINTGRTIKEKTKNRTFDYDDFLGRKLRLVNNARLYRYDQKGGVWVDKSDEASYRRRLVREGKDIRVVGVVMPKNADEEAALSTGIGYDHAMIRHIIHEAAGTAAVRAQKKNPKIDIFTGRRFGEKGSGLELANLFSIDQRAIARAFHFDAAKLDAGRLGRISPSDFSYPQLSESELDALEKALGNAVDTAQMERLFRRLLAGYQDYLVAHPLISEGALREAIEDYLQSDEAKEILAAFLKDHFDNAAGGGSADPDFTDQELQTLAEKLAAGLARHVVKQLALDPDVLVDSFSAYLETPAAQKTIRSISTTTINSKALQRLLQRSASRYAAQLQKQLQAALTHQMRSAAGRMGDILSVDPQTLAGAIKMSLSDEELRDLMSSLLGGNTASLSQNLAKLGWADEDDPSEIVIYPKNYDSEAAIESLLSSYNRRMRDAGEESKVISWSNMYASMMSTVTRIVDTVSGVLVALVAVSLIVSSIMIGVITYISVLERRKEIGILRAMGASRGNIAQIFNAETFITGLMAGLLGIGISELLLLPANHLIHVLADQPGINAALPPAAAGLLIALSVVLTVLSGLIPAGKASRSDPVAALRSE